MTAQRKNVYFQPRTLAQLGEGESLSGRVAQVIDRYAELVRRSRPEDKFSEAERSAIIDACLSWALEPAAMIFGGVAMEVDDAMRDGLASKWGIDGPALLDKLGSLNPGEQIALVDWIERQRARTA